MILLENDVYAINVTFSSIYDGRNNTFNEYELLLSIVTLYISGIRFSFINIFLSSLRNFVPDR